MSDVLARALLSAAVARFLAAARADALEGATS